MIVRIQGVKAISAASLSTTTTTTTTRCKLTGSSRRFFHSSINCKQEALQLAFEKHDSGDAKATSLEPPHAIVLCHGLFGSKQNWRTIGRALAKRCNVPVYAVDLRNHGQSPHAESMSYKEMAFDLEGFFQNHGISSAALVGHSMGGKAVMAMALGSANAQEKLSHLISVDMSPARGKLSQEFAQYIQAMVEIEDRRCKSRQEADDILKRIEPAIGIRQFLLTNLTRAADANHWTFRIPIHTIERRLAEQVGDFPFDDEKGFMQELSNGHSYPKASFSGPTLFIKGEQSKYINRKNKPICNSFFPNAEHVTLSTGHWVQAERPQEFIDELCRFIGRK